MFHHFTSLIAFLTFLNGVFTLIVIYSQMKIASAKVKLDLYERRYNIYISALNYYQALDKKEPKDIVNCAYMLIQSSRESRFLFKEKDGIQEVLIKMQNNTKITLSYFNDPMFGPLIDSGMLRSNIGGLLSKIENCKKDFQLYLKDLEMKIKPYVQFENVKGWIFF